MNTNPNAKRILCYGDSHTRGYLPDSNHIRMPANVRRTGVLQNLLGNEYEIIEEGLNSRTLETDDPRPGKGGRNGAEYLFPCLETHDPLDLVILMLGGNETKAIYGKSAKEIGKTLEEKYINVILNKKSQFLNTSPQLLLISQPYINETTPYASERFIGSREKQIEMWYIYIKK